MVLTGEFHSCSGSDSTRVRKNHDPGIFINFFHQHRYLCSYQF
jgi:hypothetical protein